MLETGAYYKRRKVEPYQMRGMGYRELHMKLEIGAFVRIERVGPPGVPNNSVQYTMVGPGVYETWDTIYERIFSIYFEHVTKEEELGLIALAELD
jgi:hypothetical protein